jgi:glyoxylase-like metal-dependent hydrolase (beta-lactamase superfamily II)
LRPLVLRREKETARLTIN